VRKREAFSVTKRSAVGDGCNDSSCNNRTNAFNRCKPAACVVLLEDPLQSGKSSEQRAVLLDDCREGSPQLAQMNRDHNAELGQQAADLIAELGAAADHPAAYPVQRLKVLLLDRFRWNEAYAGPAYGFADRFRIVGIVLL